MNTTTASLAIGAILLFTVLLRFALQPRVKRGLPQKRYRLFAVLLGVGVGSQAIGVVVAACSDNMGAEVGFLLTGFLLGMACVLEMRKLRREF